jgi:predicted transcriptional regulator YdeE
MRLVERDTFAICGYAVETTAAQNDQDVTGLYKRFFDEGKDAALLRLEGGKKGYYGLLWYTEGHEKYGYLLGMEVGAGSTPPEGAQIKTLEKTIYAVASYPQGKDAIEAWTEFFYTDIPNAGYAPNLAYNLYFEYYPGSVEGDYELWAPVVKG